MIMAFTRIFLVTVLVICSLDYTQDGRLYYSSFNSLQSALCYGVNCFCNECTTSNDFQGKVYCFSPCGSSELVFHHASLATLHSCCRLGLQSDCVRRHTAPVKVCPALLHLLVVSLLAISGLQLNPGQVTSTPQSSTGAPSLNCDLLQHSSLQSTPTDGHYFLHSMRMSMLNYLNNGIQQYCFLAIIKNKLTMHR